MSDNTTSNQLTLFAEDSLVRTSAKPTHVGKVLLAIGQGFGQNMLGSFANLSLDGSWLKMSGAYSQLTMGGTSEEFLQTWPSSGLMLRGKCYELPMLERRTVETESLSLPTVTANESKGSGANRFIGAKHFRGAKMSEGLRTCETDPIYLNPLFAELAMGFPLGWTLLEMPLCLKLQNG